MCAGRVRSLDSKGRLVFLLAWRDMRAACYCTTLYPFLRPVGIEVDVVQRAGLFVDFSVMMMMMMWLVTGRCLGRYVFVYFDVPRCVSCQVLG